MEILPNQVRPPLYFTINPKNLNMPHWYDTLLSLNTWLTPVSTLIGVATLISSLLTFWNTYFGRAARHRKWHRELLNQTGSRPAILIVNYLAEQKDITGQVSSFIKNHGTLAHIDNSLIFRLNHPSKQQIQSTNIPALSNDIVNIIADVHHAAADELNIFYAGPSFMATILGNKLKNTHFKTTLWQRDENKPGQYTPICILQQPEGNMKSLSN